MKIGSQLSDEALLRELGGRLARVRLDRNLTQAALAEQAGVAKRTLERIESGKVGTQLSGFVRVCRVLGFLERFDGLIPEPLASPITQLKRQGRQRHRATGRKTTERERRAWTWSDST